LTADFPLVRARIFSAAVMPMMKVRIVAVVS
jgi:hypothetical protein